MLFTHKIRTKNKLSYSFSTFTYLAPSIEITQPRQYQVTLMHLNMQRFNCTMLSILDQIILSHIRKIIVLDLHAETPSSQQRYVLWSSSISSFLLVNWELHRVKTAIKLNKGSSSRSCCQSLSSMLPFFSNTNKRKSNRVFWVVPWTGINFSPRPADKESRQCLPTYLTEWQWLSALLFSSHSHFPVCRWIPAPRHSVGGMPETALQLGANITAWLRYFANVSDKVLLPQRALLCRFTHTARCCGG